MIRTIIANIIVSLIGIPAAVVAVEKNAMKTNILTSSSISPARQFVSAADFGVRQQDNLVILASGGQQFDADSKSEIPGWLHIAPAAEKPENTLNSNLQDFSYKKWTHFDAKNIKKMQVVKDAADEKTVYLKIKNGRWYHEKEDVVVYCLEVNLTVRKDIPCLFVYQRIVNPAEPPQKLCYGNYISDILCYAGPDSAVQSVDQTEKKWHTLFKGNWIWIKLSAGNPSEEKKGLGIISFAPTRFCLSGPNRLFWGYETKNVKKYDALEYKMAVFSAQTPEEVKALYEKIKDVHFAPFLSAK